MYQVMIVDDYEIYRKELWSMNVWGETTGFVIADEAANGREALGKLRQRPVDLLLTDIRMPLINGLELLKKVTEEKLCHCVILMSQFSDFEYARQGLSNGAFEYLLKPVDANELLGVLLRAAASLDEKNVQISKINYLNNILNKSSDDFFPEEEFNNLMNGINEGNLDALEAASGPERVTVSWSRACSSNGTERGAFWASSNSLGNCRRSGSSCSPAWNFPRVRSTNASTCGVSSVTGPRTRTVILPARPSPMNLGRRAKLGGHRK